MKLNSSPLNIASAILPARVAAAIAILGVGISINNPAIAATLYSIMDLGNLGSSQSLTVNGINNNGQAVGYSAVNDNSFRVDAFRTAPNSPIDPKQDNLGADANIASGITAINDTGVVVGFASHPTISPYTIAIRTAPNRSIDRITDDLKVNAPGIAVAINNKGTVVAGYGRRGSAYSYRIEPNRPVNLETDNLGSFGVIVDPPFSRTYTEARDINDRGEVVGASLLPNREIHAFRTAPNQAINLVTDDLGTLGGTQSQANAINNLGQVVGFSLNANGETRAFRTNPNSPINSLTDDLGTLGGSYTYSIANDININGQVVGYSSIPFGQSRAFLHEDGTMFDLNSLIPANDFTLNYANGINDRGQIVAGGFVGERGAGTYESRIFLLTPIASTSIPDPMGVPGILLFGAVGAAFSIVRATRSLFH